MSPHSIVLEMKKLLGALDACLDKAVAYAASKKFDPNVLLQARLAPDMFPLVRQVQLACDHARNAAAQGAGKPPPSHPDTEQTVEALKQRIATVVAYLGEFSEGDFQGIDGRVVALPRWEGRSLTASNYVVEHALPNFFFHLTMAYALLRHSGVDIGKRDFIGPLSWR